MAQYVFGAGVLWGTPLLDSTGAAITNPTPIRFGAMQDVSLDLSFESKLLYGANQFPLAVGRGKGKATIKSKFAQFFAEAWNSIYFGQTLSAGLVADYNDTTGATIPTTPPFEITPTVPSSGTWSADLGVIDSNGLPMKRVASATNAGEYSVADGVYTFVTGDAGKKVSINYQYTATVAGAQKSTVQNQLMGYAPVFRADLSTPYLGKHLTFSLNNCIANKMTIAFKNDDFSVPDFEADAFVDSSGNLMTYSLSE